MQEGGRAMDEMKKMLCHDVEEMNEELFELASFIFDNPEYNYEEYKAAELLTNYLRKQGFTVETGVAGLPTAFRAEWENGTGGPVIGFLGEYDALKDLGHGCGHHLQTPICIGAALAVRKNIQDKPYKLVIYGTPAEETTGGKLIMAKTGCFKELDVAFAYHSAGATRVPTSSKALQSIYVTFHGKPSHASESPELGRSALDAMVLSFNGLEYLREHIKDGCRIHYTIKESTGPSNIVHEIAKAAYTLRAPDKIYLENMVKRFEKIIKGAVLMTETTYDVKYNLPFHNIIPIPVLRKTVLNNAVKMKLDDIDWSKDSSGGGSTDFGNVSWIIPSVVIYTDYCDAPSHTQEWVDAGKTEKARKSLVIGASLLAMSVYDLINCPDLIEQAKSELEKAKKALENRE